MRWAFAVRHHELYTSIVLSTFPVSENLPMYNGALRFAYLFLALPRTHNLSKVPVISIIDDNESVREATKILIQSLGYAAATFASAEEYLRSDHVRDTSCLIADVQMPGMSGVELQDRLIAGGQHIPVIFMTAFPAEKIRTRVLKAGAIGYLSKPFNDESLIKCLDEALKGDDASPK
jgi:FixJ family two-component response regulator